MQIKDCETCAFENVPAHDEPCASCTRWDHITKAGREQPTNWMPRRQSIDDATPAEWDAATSIQPVPTPNAVDHPPHYTTGSIECIDYMRDVLTPEEFRGYLRGQVIKYQHRLMLKGRPAEDAGKLAWYAGRLAKVLEGEQ